MHRQPVAWKSQAAFAMRAARKRTLMDTGGDASFLRAVSDKELRSRVSVLQEELERRKVGRFEERATAPEYKSAGVDQAECSEQEGGNCDDGNHDCEGQVDEYEIAEAPPIHP